MSRRTLLAILLGAALAACARTDGAIEPVWGKQPCAHCAMVLSDKRFGAQLVTDAGDRFHFDDAGCMVLFVEEHRGHVRRAWVRDAQSGAWLDAEKARYAAGAATPMDFGFEARAGGDLAWEDVRARVLAMKRRDS